MRSNLDPEHKQKEKKNLFDFKVTKSIECYENDPIFENAYVHTDVQRFLFVDGKNRVAAYLEVDKEIIPFLKVSIDYRGCNLGYQLLDFAVKRCGARKLSCDPNNKIALRMYQNYGFKVTDESEELVKEGLEKLYKMVLNVSHL